ncbi:LptF/LptG family permease [Candidatus Poribacteria bacterium]|nr:LptF/LptG family permease [Candidatus Poribacteria bacterium]
MCSGVNLLKIITRYTLREIIPPFFLAFLAFTSLLLVDKVFDLTKHFVEKGVNPWYMLEMLFYFSPAVLVLTIPMSFLVGIVTAFGRLAADNEITAMKTAGIPTYHLVIPVAVSSLILSIFMVIFMDITIPKGNDAYSRLSIEIRRKNPALVLEPDTIMDEMSRSDKKWYFESMDSETGKMKNIRIWEREGAVPKLITAKEGELLFHEGWTSLKLYNGTIYQADEKNPAKSYALGKFSQDEFYLDISGELSKERESYNSPRNMSINDIRGHLDRFKRELASPKISEQRKEYIRKGKINEYSVELYKKFSIPFACLAFGLIGVPIGLMVRRGGRMVGLGVGVALIIIYYVLLTAGEKSAKAGIYPPLLGAWTPNILTIGASIMLIIRTIHEAPIRPSRLINRLFPPENPNQDNMSRKDESHR